MEQKRRCYHPERERRRKEAQVRKDARAKRSAAQQKQVLEMRGFSGCKEWYRLAKEVKS